MNQDAKGKFVAGNKAAAGPGRVTRAKKSMRTFHQIFLELVENRDIFDALLVLRAGLKLGDVKCAAELLNRACGKPEDLQREESLRAEIAELRAEVAELLADGSRLRMAQ